MKARKKHTTNILYCVAGEGSGHSSRSKEILTNLVKNHNIHVLTYGNLSINDKWYCTIMPSDGLTNKTEEEITAEIKQFINITR